jgi:hypothetical protein
MLVAVVVDNTGLDWRFPSDFTAVSYSKIGVTVRILEPVVPQQLYSALLITPSDIVHIDCASSIFVADQASAARK